MKHIHLHLDEAIFYKLSQDKARLEKETQKEITWENYVSIIFGFAKLGRANK